jgi:hypothetical protein
MAFVDTYVVRARLKPALIVLIPLILVPFVWPVDGEGGWKALAGALVTCGGTALLSRLGGYLGKKREAALWDHFGGRPTETILSHDSSKTNPHTLRRWHVKIEELTGIHMPTAEEEARDPYAARQAAEAATTWLRVRAKADTKKYHLVFSTNCDFGFCRNTWGMKWIGLLIALAVTAVLSAKLYIDIKSHAALSRPAAGVLVVTILLLGFWVWVNRSWVRQAGERYAHALLETLDM